MNSAVPSVGAVLRTGAGGALARSRGPALETLVDEVPPLKITMDVGKAVPRTTFANGLRPGPV